MATRQPDGVPAKAEDNKDTGFKEEADLGPASARPATPAGAMFAALPPGTAFPSGLKALEGKEDGDKVKICNLTLKRVQFARVVGPQTAGKKSVIQVTMQPFETVEMTVAEARVVLTHQESVATIKASPVLVVVGRFPGNCGGKLTFHAHKRTFRTCPYHGCEYTDHAERPYSVWQAQHFMRTLKTPEAIDRFVTDIDVRDAVATLANHERRAREEAHKREQMQAEKGASDSQAVY